MITVEVNGKRLSNPAMWIIRYRNQVGHDVSKDLPKPKVVNGEVVEGEMDIATTLTCYAIFRQEADPDAAKKTWEEVVNDEIDPANAPLLFDVTNAVMKLLRERSDVKN